MMTLKTGTVSLLALMLAACAGEHGSTTASSPSPRVATSTATLVPGDIVPGRLVSVAIPRPGEPTLLHGSNPLAYQKPVIIESAPTPGSTRSFRRLMQGTDPASYIIPIENPIGARLLIHSVDRSVPVAAVHMHSVATGLRLDHGRDASNTVTGSHAAEAAEPPSGGPQDATRLPLREPVPERDALDPTAKEHGFAPLMVPARVLSFDEPTRPGLIQIDVPPSLAAAGVIVEVEEPNSHVTLSGMADKLHYGFGEAASVSLQVLEDGRPVSGASVSGWVEFPDHSHSADISFRSAGGGTYEASVPMATAEAKYIGVWNVHAKATGSSSSGPFERDIESAFGYSPAHAHMTAFGTPVVTRGAGGLIDEVSVDIDVETLADDRFSARGILSYVGDDGLEYSLASAQTGQIIQAGTGTITLHFESEALALAKVSGSFHLRDVALISQAYGITQHRLGRGLDLATGPIAAAELRRPKVVSIQAQDLIANGDLPQ